MKIAIVHPSPVPFTHGGAENLVGGLYRAINQYTDHQAELFKVSSPERDFWGLWETYEKFFNFRLEGFDLMMTTKYPAWMVKHPKKMVYLAHRLRGLYDTYEGSRIFPELPLELLSLKPLLEKRPVSRKQVSEIFNSLKSFRQNRQWDSSGLLQMFPGPLAYYLIRALDAYGYSQQDTVKYTSISRTVAEREEYFPKGATVHPIILPPVLPFQEPGKYDYFFTSSRLDHPKRIDLIVEAMRQVTGSVRLKIAGTGPEEDYLRRLAGNDPRIEFLGHVSETELLDLYVNALGVVFVPRDEDLGLITLEAMRCHKPVITVDDSGGPTEFVEDGVTGFTTSPTPEGLAEKMQVLAGDRALAERMGHEAYERMRPINWENVVKQLLEGVEPRKIYKTSKVSRRRKILVVSTYPAYPPEAGGQHRVFNIWKQVARYHDVTVLCIVRNFMPREDREIFAGFRQICIPKSREHAEKQWDAERPCGLNLFDIAMVHHIWKTKEFVDLYRELAKEADAISFEHPYLFSLATGERPDGVLIHDSHNYEFELKRPMLEAPNVPRSLLDDVFGVEKLACEKSDLTFATHQEEAETLADVYEVPLERFIVAPNGVDVEEIAFIQPETRKKRKAELGISDFPTFLFIGSYHEPNLVAVEFIVNELASQRPDWVFLIPGSVRDYYLKENPGKEVPPNVLLFGIVSEGQKKAIYEASDVALNPMFSGSGTNLKSVDYLASGIPIVCTQTGIRGLEVDEAVYVCEKDDFIDRMQHVLDHPDEVRERVALGRKLAEEKYHWGTIADLMLAEMEKLWAEQPGRLWKEKDRLTLQFGSGWYGEEYDGDRSFRWSRERAVVVIPNVGSGKKLVFEMRGTRGCPEFQFFIREEKVLTDQLPEGRWQRYEVAIPDYSEEDFLVLRWETDTYCYGGQDGRHLGVAVSHIRVED